MALMEALKSFHHGSEFVSIYISIFTGVIAIFSWSSSISRARKAALKSTSHVTVRKHTNSSFDIVIPSLVSAAALVMDGVHLFAVLSDSGPLTRLVVFRICMHTSSMVVVTLLTIGFIMLITMERRIFALLRAWR